jgi:undecaprenyl phosphate-alpha-L-ara4FN deformylase
MGRASGPGPGDASLIADDRAVVGLRVDVDTRRGLDEGVPRLLELFRRLGIRASFFVTMGPDNSGRAIRRALRPTFLAKMWRTNPVKLYGLRTLLSGTLVPARLVGAGSPAILRQIAAEGHELAPHGWDHVAWQDRIHRLDQFAVRADLDLAARSFEVAVGVAPSASAAPGWRTSPLALAAQEGRGLLYASDTRGETPFRPRVAAGVLETLQLPTTMPTMDEIVGRISDVPRTLAAAVRPGINIFTLHAEVEGGALLQTFETFLGELDASRVRLARLDDVAAGVMAAGDDLPVARVVRGWIDGRSDWIALQGRTAE